MMSFSVRMAWRETRAAWQHFLYFFICIALGVGALVGVGLFATGVSRTVTQEARALMGGDLEVRLSRPISREGQAILDALARDVRATHVSELIAMAARAELATAARHGTTSVPVQLIELKAVDHAYPLYGAVATMPDRPLDGLLARGPCDRDAVEHDCFGAVVQEALLIKMGLAVGQEMKIGQARFRVTGILTHEPDRVASAFSLGPRVLISQAGLAGAALVKPGSRVRERHLIRLAPDMSPEPLLARLRVDLAAEAARVSSFRDAQPQLRRFLDQLTRYLGLIGLTALFVGGIGVATTIHAFVKDKVNTIAILKTVGAGSGMIVRTYLLQAVLLGAIGSVAGVLLGLVLERAVPSLLAVFVPAEVLHVATMQSHVMIGPIVRGIVLGVATTVLFALWPLLGIRAVRPAEVFRRETVARDAAVKGGWHRVFADRLRLSVAAAILLGLAALAMWEARSMKVGMIFIAAVLAAVLILVGAAKVLVRVLARLSRPASLTLRYAVRNLSRPGSHAVGITVAVGIGVMIIVTIALVERALIDQIGESRPVDAPTFFLIDIQPDQQEAVRRLLVERWPASRPEFTPLVRSRLHALNGQEIGLNEEDDKERTDSRGGEHGRSWYRTREYVLTFLDGLPKDNRIVRGQWWNHGSTSEVARVSVEEEAARNLGLTIGSTVDFDIQGTVLHAEVTSIRSVEWSNFSTNFYMILSPGSLDGAPFTYVATVRVMPDQEVPLQQAVVTAFPNVTAINVGEVMSTFARVLEQLSLAIRAMAAFCLVTGTIVMAAALATTRYRRLYESVILKALGATRPMIAASFAAEYALIGAAAGLIGLGLATLLSLVSLEWMFDLRWTFHPGIAVIAVTLTICLTLSVGFLATFRILGQRPLAILRHE